MSDYFTAYSEDAVAHAVDTAELERIADPGGPVLPFDYLDPRHFEILAYRLLAAEYPDDHPVLMQGTGERGRDVVVYRGGAIRTIVQCKNRRDRVTAKQVKQELIKLALHSYLEPRIVPAGATYELWAPGGLSETAEPIFADWPKTWRSSDLEDDTNRVLEQYAAFETLEWTAVSSYLLEDFPARIQVTRVTSVDLTPRVHSKPAVYASFFGARIGVDSTVIRQQVREMMVESGALALSDVDVRRMIDRISSFDPKERLVFHATTIFGISAELVAKFNRAEYSEFLEHAISSTFKIVNVLMAVCRRLEVEQVAEFRRVAGECHPALPQLIGKLLRHSMFSCLNRMTMGNLTPKYWNDYLRASLDDRLDMHTRDSFEDYLKCIDGYDPTIHVHGSNEELRQRIGQSALAGARSLEQFVTAIASDRRRHLALIELTYRNWMKQMPHQILIVADTVSVFQDRSLFRRMIEQTNHLTELRGSDIVPE